MTTDSRARAAGYDAVVVGGGPGGLSAALYLGRARRRALVVDAGQPRNAKAHASHGVFTRDGTAPGELLAEARRQLATYPTIEFRSVAAVGVSAVGTGFAVHLQGGQEVHARRLVIACGLRDELPPIDDLADHWGGRVFNCSYCHGFEEADRPIALLVTGKPTVQSVASLLQLTKDITLYTNGPTELSIADRHRIERLGAGIEEARVLRVSESPGGLALHLADGSVRIQSAMLVKTTPHLASEIPVQLGCGLNDSGGVIVDATWQTTVPGVYAAGDIAIQRKSVAMAAASGVEAAVCVDVGLTKEDFGA